MPSDKNESAAITAQRAMIERIKATTDGERQRELDTSHGRNVGGVDPRVLDPAHEQRAADALAPPVKK